MMKKWNLRGRFLRVFVPASGLLALGSCGLNDQQLTGILSSVVTTGLTTIVTSILSGLTATGGG